MITLETLKNGFEYLVIQNGFGTAKVALQGAHLFAYQATDKTPLFWVSETAYYQENKAIRGGIPICWPWFGPHPTESTLPQHGFARNSKWQIASWHENQKQSTVVMRLSKVWEYAYELTLTITLSKKLELSLKTTNQDTKSFEISQALHSYFDISDIAKTTVIGLESSNYFDQLSKTTQTQKEVIVFNQEIDRVYFHYDNHTIEIDDGNRKIRILSSGSTSTVVWNPWIEKSSNMADVHNAGYKEFICVESANALKDQRTLYPSESHALTMSVEY